MCSHDSASVLLAAVYLPSWLCSGLRCPLCVACRLPCLLVSLLTCTRRGRKVWCFSLRTSWQGFRRTSCRSLSLRFGSISCRTSWLSFSSPSRGLVSHHPNFVAYVDEVYDDWRSMHGRSPALLPMCVVLLWVRSSRRLWWWFLCLRMSLPCRSQVNSRVEPCEGPRRQREKPPDETRTYGAPLVASLSAVPMATTLFRRCVAALSAVPTSKTCCR